MVCTCVHQRKSKRLHCRRRSSTCQAAMIDMFSSNVDEHDYLESKSMKCSANYTVQRFPCPKHRSRTSSPRSLLPIPRSIPICYVRSFADVSRRSRTRFLCSVGEAAGKALLGVAKKEDVNINHLRGKADSANSAIHDTRMVSGIFPAENRQALSLHWLRRNYSNVVRNWMKLTLHRNKWLIEQKNALFSLTSWC